MVRYNLSTQCSRYLVGELISHVTAPSFVSLFLLHPPHAHSGNSSSEVRRCQRSSTPQHSTRHWQEPWFLTAPCWNPVHTHQWHKPRRVKGYTAVLKQGLKERPRAGIRIKMALRNLTRVKQLCWEKTVSTSPSPLTPKLHHQGPTLESRGKGNCKIIWHKIRVEVKYFITTRIKVNLLPFSVNFFC